MPEAVIVDALRTPFCRGDEKRGWLRNLRSDDLGVMVVRELIRRNDLDPGLIDEVIMGTTNQRGEQHSPGRNIAILSGIPFTATGLSVERACVSSMTAAHLAAMSIQCGLGEVYIAGGLESMTRFRLPRITADNPMTLEEYFQKTGRNPNLKMLDFVDPAAAGMGMTAENLSEMFAVPRRDQDLWAVRSNHRAAAAYKDGLFQREILPVEGEMEDGSRRLIDMDQDIRPDAAYEKISTLPTIFKPAGGTVNAANSSKESDGAAALLIMSQDKAKALGLQPLVLIRKMAVAGVDPKIMGYSATKAAAKVLQKSGLSVDDIDLFEINEAFAVVVLTAIKELGIKEAEDRVNVNGGACCIGHPVGASGARILGTLAYEMNRRGSRYGLASICGGMGQGGATLLER